MMCILLYIILYNTSSNYPTILLALSTQSGPIDSQDSMHLPSPKAALPKKNKKKSENCGRMRRREKSTVKKANRAIRLF